jgi:hypothetical protein
LKKKWKKNERGQLIRKYSKKLLLINWADKKDVRILGSIGKASNDRGKPELVHLYNKAMPGVDLADQYRHGKQVARSRFKDYHKKVFLHFVDVVLVNAFILAKYIPGFSNTHADFRLSLIDSILRKYGVIVPQVLPDRLSGTHTKIIKNATRGRCFICRMCKKSKLTPYLCGVCQVYLCIEPCYHIYHTKRIIQ